MTRHFVRRFAIAPPRSTHSLPFSVASSLTRIFSDLHYGDRASRVTALAQLRPLTDGLGALILNGDTLDTRVGPRPEHTAACRDEVLAFAASSAPGATLLTGNHDPDLSSEHAIVLAGGQVVATHGDIVFDDIVPWGRDAPAIRPKIAAAFAKLPPDQRTRLEHRFAIWRAIAASIPQRHQSEPQSLKYALRFAADTVWPPLRILRILRAWRDYPALVAEFAAVHWPKAKFVIVGHTHRPSIWSRPGRATVINTGSFCPPLGSYAVDLEPGRLVIRAVEPHRGEFHPGGVVAEFPLAEK